MDISTFLTQGRQTKKLSETIRELLPSTNRIKIISGYLSKRGFTQTFGPDQESIKENGKKIEYIVVGRLTLECAEIFDELYCLPEYKDKLFVNLGIGRLNKSKTAITRFIPMVHSKIIALNPTEDGNLFYIGSANITHFALEDLNAEAGIILENLDESQRNEISKYMDNLKTMKSTILYNPSLKDSLIDLSNLSADPTEKDLESIDTSLLVLCLNPTQFIPKPKDVLFADLPRHLPEEIIKFHQKTKRCLILLLFSSLPDLLNMSFDKAKVLFTRTESINDIAEANRSIERNINGMIYYDPVTPPLLIPMKQAPTANPEDFHSQMKCSVLSYADVPKKHFEIFNDDTDITPRIRNLVIRKKTKEFQEFKIDQYSTMPFPDGIYAEILLFKKIKKFSFLFEIREEISQVKLDIPRGDDLNTYGMRFNEMLEGLPDDGFHAELLRRYSKNLRKTFDQLVSMTEKDYHNFIFLFSSFLRTE
jgi:hypothetical protein